VIVDKLFRDRDTLISGRFGRWLVVIIALALGGFLAIAPGGQDEQLNHIAGAILLVLGGLALLYAIVCEYLIIREGHVSPQEWNRQEEERRVREGIEQATEIAALYGASYGASQPDTPWSS
jgi:uncharacterized membrane protein